METKFVKISTSSGKQPEQPLKIHPICTNLHQIFITNAKKRSWIFVWFIHKKPSLATLSCAVSPGRARGNPVNLSCEILK
jgi:hypothetical protein